MLMLVDDQHFMRLAIAEALAALEHDDVPVGAVAIRRNEVVASAHNERELRQDPTAHAEILALRRASEKLGSWHLDDVTLYSTLEPCPMCAGALVAARIERLVYGAPDEKAGAAYTLYNIPQDPRLNHECRVTAGLLVDETSQLLQTFFRRKRRRVDSL
jgi:tRNA(adenine34) deaminase